MGIKEQIEALTTEARAKCTHLIVSAAVRYWEDATVNGEADTEGKLIPLRVGDAWEPTIELATGKIIGRSYVGPEARKGLDVLKRKVGHD